MRSPGRHRTDLLALLQHGGVGAQRQHRGRIDAALEVRPGDADLEVVEVIRVSGETVLVEDLVNTTWEENNYEIRYPRRILLCR